MQFEKLHCNLRQIGDDKTLPPPAPSKFDKTLPFRTLNQSYLWIGLDTTYYTSNYTLMISMNSIQTLNWMLYSIPHTAPSPTGPLGGANKWFLGDIVPRGQGSLLWDEVVSVLCVVMRLWCFCGLTPLRLTVVFCFCKRMRLRPTKLEKRYYLHTCRIDSLSLIFAKHW